MTANICDVIYLYLCVHDCMYVCMYILFSLIKTLNMYIFLKYRGMGFFFFWVENKKKIQCPTHIFLTIIKILYIKIHIIKDRLF